MWATKAKWSCDPKAWEYLIGFLGPRTIPRNFLCQFLGVQSAQRIRFAL